MASNRAQISMEAVVGVVVILLVAVVVSVFSLQRSQEASLFSQNSVSSSECEKLSSIIYILSSSGAKPSLVFSLDANALVDSSGLITVGEYYCDFLGSAATASLKVGSVKAFKNSEGVVSFEQVS